MLKGVYLKIHSLAQHGHATYYLAFLSAVESFCSPITPLFLLIPMVIAMPQKSWSLVNIATLASTAGSVVGYILGYEFLHLVKPWIDQAGYAQHYETAVQWYNQWDFLALLVSSIFPIPFKLFTIVAGMLQTDFFIFILMVIIVRWLHFALIPVGVHWFAAPMMRWAKGKFE